MGSDVEEKEISENPTVQGLFDACYEDFPQDCKVTRRGVDVNPDTELNDGDKVFVGKKVKGNQEGDPFEVKLIKMGAGGGIKSMGAEEGMTIKQVIDQMPSDERASYYKADDSPAYEYRINHEIREQDFKLVKPAGERAVSIILSQKVKGN